MMRLPLSNGGFALVDDADFEHLAHWRWHRHPGGYAARTANGGRKVLMHREIAAPPAGLEVDHINRDKLDNRRANLRVVDHPTNQRNTGPQANNTSGYKGVTWDKNRQKWVAKTRHLGKHIFIGRFGTAEEAADAYETCVRGLTVVPQVAEHIGRLLMGGAA